MRMARAAVQPAPLPISPASSRLPAMKKLIAPAFVLLLAGCGFHLRQPLDLPMDVGPVRVISQDPYSPLGEALAQAMTRAGAAAPADPTATVGVARLEILSERWGNLPISLDSQGRAQEFSLRYAVVFALRDGNDRVVVPQQVVELSRDYLSPPSDSIGTDNEADLLARELRRDMVAAILRRISAATRPLERDSEQNVPPPVD